MIAILEGTYEIYLMTPYGIWNLGSDAYAKIKKIIIY